MLGQCVTSVAAELTVVVNDKKGITVDGTVVELVGDQLQSTTTNKIVINQVDREFEPMVSNVMVGSEVAFTNEDDYNHHVYSISSGNKFDLPLFKDKPPRNVIFNAPGVVKIGCNIHDWMLAYTYVQQSDRLIVLQGDNAAVFEDVPAGSYQVRVWNPKFRNTKKIVTSTVEVGANDKVEHVVQVSQRKKIRKRFRRETKYD